MNSHLQINTFKDIENYFYGFSQPIFYLVAEVEQALGLLSFHPEAHVVCLHESALMGYLASRGFKILHCPGTNTSRQMLKTRKLQRYLAEVAQDRPINLLFFKLNFDPRQLLPHDLARKTRVLNISPRLNQQFEDKTRFFQFCSEHNLPVPPGEVKYFSQLNYQKLAQKYGPRLIVQFGRGWAGKTSFLVQGAAQFNQLKKRFRHKKVRLSQFIPGPTLTINACVTRYGTLSSLSFKQITGDPRLTRQPLGTCGNDWNLSGVAPKIQERIIALTVKVGDLMRQQGYRGYFGLDFVVAEKARRVFITENNARLTASVPMFTQLEVLAEQVPLLALHLLEFLGANYEINLTWLQKQKMNRPVSGAQLIGRNILDKPSLLSRYQAGVYQLKESILAYQHPGIFISDLKTKNTDEFLLFTKTSSRIVKPDEELFRLQSWGQADISLLWRILAQQLKQK